MDQIKELDKIVMRDKIEAAYYSGLTQGIGISTIIISAVAIAINIMFSR